MSTTYVSVPAGTVSAVLPITPVICASACPAVLGGTVLMEFSKDGRTNWLPWVYGTISQGGSLRPDTNGYIRVTATTQNAALFMIDMTGSNTPLIDQLVNVNETTATANATAEQVLLSFRIPPNFLPANFKMTIILDFSFTNNANVKSVAFKAGGLAGTALFTSPSLASALNYNALVQISGRGDGQSLIGFGAGTAGGAGTSTTAYPTASLNYITSETEFVVTGTKATGTDTLQLESCVIQLY